ncbi:MAG: indole-3-glycerol phosphate synthase TrpC [Oscillospiraceae bacterium]|nr:indole-3-glycerol phosphate synthase TrpC [Oscillospiraceae bacterium]
MTILEKIVEKTKIRVEKLKKEKPDLTAFTPVNPKTFTFEKALKTPELSLICEVKKASPSKGIIAEHFPYAEIAKEYEAAGAAAISVLTEPEFFLGSNQYLTDISKAVKTPLLRKDFIIDEVQIYEAFQIGASAILLIAAILEPEPLKQFIKTADSLGLSALVETRNEEEIKSALQAGARIIGVNNRDLHTFKVDVETTVRLRRFVPDDIIYIAESGIATREDILKLGKIDAVLIGETLMKSENKKRVIQELKGL